MSNQFGLAASRLYKDSCGSDLNSKIFTNALLLEMSQNPAIL
jgi:hypothetical protein